MKYIYWTLGLVVIAAAGLFAYLQPTKPALTAADHTVVSTTTPVVVSSPTPSPSSIPLQFTPIPTWTTLTPTSDQSGVYKKVKHLVRTDAEGKAELFVDEITDNSSGTTNLTFHYKLLYNGKVVTEKDIDDKDMTQLLPDSHVFIAKFPPQNNQAQNGPNIKKEQEYDSAVAILVFKRKNNAKEFRIIGLTENQNQFPSFNVTTHSYEFSKVDTEPNESIVIHDQFGIPIAWNLNHYMFLDNVTRENHHNINFGQMNIPQEAYDNLQTQLEQKIRGTKDKAFLYFAHLELAKLYNNKAQQNPLNPFDQKSKKETRAAIALQPQAPFKTIHGSLKFCPFTFRAQVDEATGINGEYGFKVFRVNTAGKVKLSSNTLLDWIDLQAESLRGRRAYGSITRGFISSVNNYPNSSSSSPSGNYLITLGTDRNTLPTDFSTINLVLHTNGQTTAPDTMPQVLDTGNPEVLGWHPQKDLFYFLVNNFQTRDSDLWQFDAKTSRFLKIGNTNKMVYLSPDGNWIVWGDGGNGSQEQMTTGFNAFSIKKSVNYRLTHSFEPKYFIGWDTPAQ
jgi:hypothetical protein